MNPELYEAYREWREGMLSLQDDFMAEEDADFSVWDAADHAAREDLNLYLAARALDQVSFTEMKEMELRYDAEY